MTLVKRGEIWWYDFQFGNQRIRESTKSTSKVVAKAAEQQRRRDLEHGFHNITEIRENRIRLLRDVAAKYLDDYRLRFRGVTFWVGPPLPCASMVFKAYGSSENA